MALSGVTAPKSSLKADWNQVESTLKARGLNVPTVFCMWDWNPNLTKSCLFLWSVTNVRLQGPDLEIVVLRTFAIMAPMLSVEWQRGHWYTFKVQVLNIGRSMLGVNVQSRFRFCCDIEGQCHISQAQIIFHEIWIPISHAKHCSWRVQEDRDFWDEFVVFRCRNDIHTNGCHRK